MPHSNLPYGYSFDDRAEAENLKKLSQEYLRYATPANKNENREDAIGLLKVAMSLSRNDPEIRGRLGVLLYKQVMDMMPGATRRNYKPAIFYLTQASYAEPDPQISRAYLVKALMNDRQDDRAMFHAEEGVRDYPDDYHFWTCRGALEMGRGQFENSVFSLRNAAERLPPPGEAGPEYAMLPDRVMALYAEARRMLERKMSFIPAPPES